MMVRYQMTLPRPLCFCQKGGDGASSTSPDANSASASQKQKGLVDLSHESIDFMTDKGCGLDVRPDVY